MEGIQPKETVTEIAVTSKVGSTQPSQCDVSSNSVEANKLVSEEVAVTAGSE